MKNTLKVSGLLLVAAPAAAAAEPLPKQVADMDCIVGAWKGGGSLTMGTAKSPIAATWTCKRTSAQFGVLCSAALVCISSYEELEMSSPRSSSCWSTRAVTTETPCPRQNLLA